jgi:hypothetical protein
MFKHVSEYFVRFASISQSGTSAVLFNPFLTRGSKADKEINDVSPSKVSSS